MEETIVCTDGFSIRAGRCPAVTIDRRIAVVGFAGGEKTRYLITVVDRQQCANQRPCPRGVSAERRTKSAR